jgi:hypothetical protein
MVTFKTLFKRNTENYILGRARINSLMHHDDDDDKISQFPNAGSTQNAEEWREGKSELLFRKATRSGRELF